MKDPFVLYTVYRQMPRVTAVFEHVEAEVILI